MIAGVLASVGAAVLWVALAGWRPTVTLHLAPVVVVGTAPYVAWSRSLVDRRGKIVVSALLGGGIAVLTTAALTAVSWLQGPTWFGADATREAVILAAVATAVSVLIATLAGDRASQRR